MKTVDAIWAEVRHHKTCSKIQLRRYLAAFNIKPLGVRQRPQLYPDDAAKRILTQLGLSEDLPANRPTMDELRKERAAAKTRRKAA